MIMDVYRNLDPQRLPNMSLQMAAILELLLEREYTMPLLDDVQVTTDVHVLAWSAEHARVGRSKYLGLAADPRANLRRLGMATGLDEVEWAEYAIRVGRTLGMDLGSLGRDVGQRDRRLQVSLWSGRPVQTAGPRPLGIFRSAAGQRIAPRHLCRGETP
jgi:hypothetical protein